MMILVIGNKQLKMLGFQDLNLWLQDFAINHGLLPVETILSLNLLVRYLVTFFHLQMNRKMDNLNKNFNQKAVTRVWIGGFGSWGHFHGLR